MKKKWIGLLLALLFVLPLCAGCFGGTGDTPESTPIIEAGEEVTVSGRAEGGEFKMAISVDGYIDGAAFEDYAKKMSLSAPMAGGAANVTFRLEEYEGKDALDPNNVYLMTFTGEDGTESEGWLTEEPVYDMLGVFESVAVGESTNGWIYFDIGEATPQSLRMDFSNAAGIDVSVLFTLPEAEPLPEEEMQEIAFNTPVQADGAEFTVTKMQNAPQVASALSATSYEARDGDEFAVLKMLITNTGTEPIDQQVLNAYYETTTGENYASGAILTQAKGEELEQSGTIEAGETADLYFPVPMPLGTQGSGKFVLSVSNKNYSIPYMLHETQDSAGTLETGQTVSTATEEFTLKEIERGKKVNPPKTSGEYNYVETNEQGYTFLTLIGTYKNNGEQPVEIKNRMGMLAEKSDEMYMGEVRILSAGRNGFEAVTTVQPGEEREAYFMVSVPEDIPTAELMLRLATLENEYIVSGLPE